MKKYMMFLMAILVGSSDSLAGSMFDNMSKEELSNYEITVTDKRTGKVIGKMDRSTHKVVSLESSESKELPESVKLAAQKVGEKIKENARIANKYRDGYGTVILHAGVGKDGLDRGNNGKAWEVSEKDSAIAGFTGCISKEAKGLCGSVFTNKTFLFGLKLDF